MDPGWPVVAERFYVWRPGFFIDLATGARVSLRIRQTPDAVNYRRWLERCATLAGLWHPHLLVPLDYGLLPDGRRFEAVPHSLRPACETRAACATAMRSALAFLERAAISGGRADLRRVRTAEGRLALLADEETGHPADRDLPRRRRPVHVTSDDGGFVPPGVRLQPRTVLDGILDVLDVSVPGRSRTLTLRAPPGSGLRTLLRQLAAEARRRGYVPVDVGCARRLPGLIGALASRHVLLIEVRTRHAHIRTGPGLLLELGLSNPRSHVLLTALRSGRTGAGLLELDPIGESALMAMLIGTALDAAQVRAAAVAASGRPGRFLERLGAGEIVPRTTTPAGLSTVREVAPDYRARGLPPSRPEHCVGRARKLAHRGRAAAAIRLLRAGVAACARRGQARTQAELALELARLLSAQGRADDAATAFVGIGRAGDERLRVQAALGLAEARLDQGRLAEAEAAARGARLVAESGQLHDHLERAGLTLARVLYWGGRTNEARALLEQPCQEARFEAERQRMVARLALEGGRVALASRTATVAFDLAARCHDARGTACAHGLRARIAGVLGDRPDLECHVEAGLVASREAGLPLVAAEVRLEAAAGALQGGDTVAARRLVQGLLRRAEHLPALTRARIEAVLARCGDAGAAASTNRFVQVTGARALHLKPPEERDMELIQQAAELMRLCHEADGARQALHDVCRALTTHLQARAVSIVARRDGAACAVAAAGTGWAVPEELVATALEAATPVLPRQSAAALEGAAAIRYAGRPIGVIACRWAIDASIEFTRARALLAAAAVACAPAVQEQADARLPAIAPDHGATAGLLGESAVMADVRALVRRSAHAPFPVLVEGESGAGKELVARAIHSAGPRRGERFCAVNCAALGDELLEAELFGHARGAFTGAVSERAGLFEDAHRGTLFLDEVIDLSARAQAKLLRALQEGEVRRLGENAARRVDVRIVAAANRPLSAATDEGRFRSDLRYRLEVIRIVVPPLRERVEDIPLLVSHYWRQATARVGSRATLTAEALATFARYDWPGNVRELQNVLAALAVGCAARGRIGPASLPAHIARTGAATTESTLDEARLSFERRFVRAAMARAGGHRGRAARALGISRQGLAKLLKRLDLDVELPGSSSSAVD
jgi:DNA-binding NtrC family response regulator